MKRTVMVLVMSLVATLGAPWASAGQPYGYGGGQRGQYTASSPDAQPYNTPRAGNGNSGYWTNDRDTQRFGNTDRGYDNRGYSNRDYNNYNNNGYDRYDYRDHHVGRSVAIIGGSAAGGALIGGLAGQGKGAAVGAVVGGVAGLIGDQIARHHDHRR